MGDKIFSDCSIDSGVKRRLHEHQADFGQYEKVPADSTKDKLNPWAAALGARAAYLGLTGTLIPTNAALKDELQKAGDIGEQLVKKMGRMEKEGWSIGNTFLYFPEPKAGWGQAFVDNFEQMSDLEKKCVNFKYRTLMTLASPITNFFLGGAANDRLKVVCFSGLRYSLQSILSGSLHGANPLKLTAPILAHELSHNDGIPVSFEPKQLALLTNDERRVLAERLLKTEARAHLVQSAVADALKTPSFSSTRLKPLIIQESLGSDLFKRYNGVTSGFKSFELLNEKQADALVEEYFSRHFGGNIVDPKTGKYRNFNIHAGLTEKIGSTQFDDELLGKMNKINFSTTAPKYGLLNKLLSRGGQTVLGLSALATGADLMNGYKSGIDAGTSQVVRSGTSLIGFEIGSAVLGKMFTRGTVIKLCGTILGGAIGSDVMDKFAGKQLEQTTKTVVRNIGKSLNIAHLSPESASCRPT